MLLRRSEDSLEKKITGFFFQASRNPLTKIKVYKTKVGKQNSTIQYYIP